MCLGVPQKNWTTLFYCEVLFTTTETELFQFDALWKFKTLESAV